MLVHWLWVLGFTLAICKSVMLKSRNSAVLDSETFSTVQPNLRCYAHVAPLGLSDIWVRHILLYTLRFAGALASEVSVFYRSAGEKGRTLDGREDPAPTGKLLDFQYLDSVDIWVSRYESRPTSYLPVFDWSGGSGKMLDLRVCVQVTAYGVCLLLYNPPYFHLVWVEVLVCLLYLSI